MCQKCLEHVSPTFLNLQILTKPFVTCVSPGCSCIAKLDILPWIYKKLRIFTASVFSSCLQRDRSHIMAFLTVSAVILCWLSVSLAAPLACEELIRPLDQLQPHRLVGRWELVAGSLSHLPSLEKFKQRDSASIHFSSNTSENSLSYSRSLCLGNKSLYTSYNISLEGSSFTYDGTDKSNVSASFVHTSCHDCLLMRMNVESGKRIHFYLFSRRRRLEQEEMEEFQAQVRCLNMPQPAVMDPEKRRCPEIEQWSRRSRRR